MEFLKQSDRLSFLYDGVDFREWNPVKEQTVKENEVITAYIFADGLKVTNHARKHEAWGAWEWFNTLENTGSENTGILSELWDCDARLPVDHREPREKTPWMPSKERDLFVLNPNGSTTVDEWDFYAHLDDGGVKYKGFLFPNSTPMEFHPIGGRSSDGNAPFFNIHQAGKGYVVALGWSGQWNAAISRTENFVCLRSKIEDTHFRLYPGESIRTSSVLIMPYEGTVEDGQNRWRRLIREVISPVKEGCGALPLALSIWTGTPSAEIIRRTEYAIEECKIPFNYLWNDAGWCGADTLPTSNEYSGDWAEKVGDWEISPLIHPNGLQDVADKIHSYGKKYILWFEPERVRKTAAFARKHPEYLLSANSDDPTSKISKNYLMYLGNEDAWQYCYGFISDMVERLGVDCYRQDFNFSPLPFWRQNDTPDRVGITEIKHTLGLYRLWDALLERFPGLLIDNCASGGKRWDLETLRRSIALWRSDAQCPADPNPEVSQAQLMNFAWWMPYPGAGSGRVYDTYRMRSAYTTSLSTTYSYSANEHFGSDPAQVSWLKERCEEYLCLRPYFDGDVYHLTKPLKDESSWCAVQWDRPETKDGMIQVFKREKSPYTEAWLALRKIDPSATYRITDLDGGEWKVNGAELAEQGLKLVIREKRVAKIYFYRKED